MNVIISEQLIFFLKSILLGILLGLIFDVFKILRLSIKHSNIFIFIEDILFFCMAAVFSYNFMINISFGQIRLFILSGHLIGFILYKLSISNFIVKFVVYIISLLTKIVKLFFDFMIKPLYEFILYIFKIIFGPVIRFFIKNIKFIKKLLQSRLMIVYNFLKRSFIKNKIIDQ